MTRNAVITGPGPGGVDSVTPGDRTASTESLANVQSPVTARRHAWSGGVHASILLIVGIVLGRHGLGVLSDATLSLIDPVVPVALASVGVIVAFEMTSASFGRQVLAAAGVHWALACAAVAAGTLALSFLLDGEPVTPVLVAIALGVCASSSSGFGTRDAGGGSSTARFIDLDALFAVGAGAIVILAMHHPEVRAASLTVSQLGGIVIVVALIAWLLLTPTVSHAEQRVFITATVLLLGGVADYLSESALLAGLLAGLCWHVAGGVVRESIQRDLIRLQHPLVALVLVVAGARTEFTPAIVTLTIAYVLLRATAKLAGSLAGRMAAPGDPASIASRLLAPGVLGVAFALNLDRASESDMTIVLSVATLGTIAAQILAGLRSPEAHA
jgi:hypothetical protein